jgi:hypothetical protein
MSSYVSYTTNIQILKDIERTFAHSKYFDKKSSSHGFNRLHRLLIALSTYRGLGYVQGLNFIAASFLWHCDEELAYYVIVELFSRLKMETLFDSHMVGVNAKCDEFFEQYLRQQSPEIYSDLTEKQILGQMILPEWIITLGFMLVPIKFHMILIKGLLAAQWPFLHRVMLCYFRLLFKIFRRMKFDEALMMIKRAHEENTQKAFGFEIDWQRILDDCQKF